MSLTRTLVAALAAASLAAPSALAQPADMHAGRAQPAKQDLRSPDTRDAATRPAAATRTLPSAPTSAACERCPNGPMASDWHDAATRPASARAQDLRHLRAGGDATTQAPLPGPPTWPAHPQPISAPITAAPQRDDGIDPATIALGIAGSLLAVAAIAGIANRNRRTQRQRATA